MATNSPIQRPPPRRGDTRRVGADTGPRPPGSSVRLLPPAWPGRRQGWAQQPRGTPLPPGGLSLGWDAARDAVGSCSSRSPSPHLSGWPPRVRGQAAATASLGGRLRFLGEARVASGSPALWDSGWGSGAGLSLCHSSADGSAARRVPQPPARGGGTGGERHLRWGRIPAQVGPTRRGDNAGNRQEQ